MKQVRVAILGTGQIGTDLAVKISRLQEFELVLVAGRRDDSPGIKFLNNLGIKTVSSGIDGILSTNKIDLVFDCTSAQDHKKHWVKLASAGIAAIDMTPAKIGKFFVPNVTTLPNDDQQRPEDGSINLNMVTCGGQSASPIAYALSKYRNITRIELASNIASKSAGPATRANIDEYIETTESVLCSVTGALESKAILILNPADPPIFMQNTLYVTFEDSETVDLDEVNSIIKDAVRKVQAYVPGYQQITRAVMIGAELSVTIKVKGNGDYLPEYSGNLDIINSSAIQAAHAMELAGYFR